MEDGDGVVAVGCDCEVGSGWGEAEAVGAGGDVEEADDFGCGEVDDGNLVGLLEGDSDGVVVEGDDADRSAAEVEGGVRLEGDGAVDVEVSVEVAGCDDGIGEGCDGFW